MRLYYHYLIFKLVFHNKHTLILFFPFISFWFLSNVILKNPAGVVAKEVTIEKGAFTFLVVFIVLLIVFYNKLLKKFSSTFLTIKYSNFYASSFKLFSEKDKRLFYQYIHESILNKDLNLDKLEEEYKESPRYQQMLLKELNSITFKKKLISELSYPRFINEVEIRQKKSGWIRDFINYKEPYKTAVLSALRNASVPSILNNIDGIKQAILVNIHLGENKVNLNAGELRKNLMKVDEDLETINLEHRIILNPRITQKQFARVLDTYAKDNLNGFKAVRFVAFFSGFENPRSNSYDCQNRFTPYVMDLTDDETKEFISVLRFLMEKNVLLGRKINTYTKLELIIELFVENCLLDKQLIRKSFSSYEHSVSLDKTTIRKINSYIDKKLPPLLKF